jgi:hypothetical protein
MIHLNKSMMKTKFFAIAAIACGIVMSMTSCTSNNDMPVVKKTATISFEGQTVNADGFWIGAAEGNSYSYSDDWGGTTTTYTDNVYKEGPVTFPVTYNLYTSAYGTSDFWSGFAISNRTATTFDAATMTPDQYNNVTGKAHGGNQFCVVTTYGETITVPDAVVKGLWFTNSSYTANSILHGDSYSGGAFDATDWLKCTITGKTAQGTESSVEIDLAKDGDYVKTWQYCDLTSLGKVVELSFAFTGSRTGEYGLNTPAYICIDDIEISL